MDSYEIDKKLEPILRRMERDGVKLDVEFLENLSHQIGLKLLRLEAEIYNSVGHKFNLNSPKQMAEVLYKELKIEPAKLGIRRRKTHPSTGAQDLRKIRHLHPAIDHLLAYRELAKLKNTYLDPLPRMVDEDSRLHTNYAVDTATGRLSSKNPNLQNIPSRGEAGAEIRKAFIAEKECKLLVADYSQIELRIAAHFSQDPIMIEIFEEGKDIHRATAEELGVDRRTAKIFNFSILYGVSAYGLAETLDIFPEEAQILIDKYFLAFPRLANYIQELIRETEETGYVETLFGRKRMIPELQSPIERVRRFGQRVAINTPLQGTAAEIIKLAMITIAKTLNKAKSQKGKLILQIHDELVFEVPEDKIKETAKIVKEIMESVVKLRVPLIVNLSIGKNWGELQPIKA